MFKPIAVSHREPMPNMQYGDAVYVRSGANKNAAPAAGTNQKLTVDTDKIKQVEDSLSEKLRSGDLLKNAVNLTDRFETVNSSQMTEDGKKIVDNRDTRIIVKNYTPGMRDPISANDAAKSGWPTHGFFYEDTDFLTEAAKEYSTLGDDEVFRFRHIHDTGFVRNTLDFFTNGNYTEDDVHRMQDQMTDLVRELGKQIKNGETLDFSKAQTKLTVGGVDTTLSELLDMQKTGRVVSEDLEEQIGIGNHIMTDVFGQIGIAKAMGNAYGAACGSELGTKFSEAVDRLYDKTISVIEREGKRTVEQAKDGSGYYHCAPQIYQDVMDADLKIADMFSKLDTSSKEVARTDFSAKLKQADSIIDAYCRKHGLPSDSFKPASAKDRLKKYMESWLNG